MNSVIDYIKKKREFVKNDYKLHFLFENLIVKENEELYQRKVIKLEEKTHGTQSAKKMNDFFKMSCIKHWKTTKITGVKTIHIANLSGFNDGDIAFNKDANTNDPIDEQATMFLDAFEKLVTDPEMIPQKSVIILSTDEHHMGKVKKYERACRSAEKKRKLAAESKGQKSITNYFKSAKNAPREAIKKEEYKVDDIIARVRGAECDIQILWLPNVELNPCSYVSVVFNSEVMRYLEENDSNLNEACEKVIDTLPNSIWDTYYDFITELEDTMMEENQRESKKLRSSTSDDCEYES